eukprot:6267568-Alexandrium_andersonii.AAC.1
MRNGHRHSPVGTCGDLWGSVGTFGDLRGPSGTCGDLWGPVGMLDKVFCTAGAPVGMNCPDGRVRWVADRICLLYTSPSPRD